MNIKLVPVTILLYYFFGTGIHPVESISFQWVTPSKSSKFLETIEPSGYTNFTTKSRRGSKWSQFFMHIAMVKVRGKTVCGQMAMDQKLVLYPNNGRQAKILKLGKGSNVQVLKFAPGTMSWIKWDEKKKIEHLNVIKCGVYQNTGETAYPCRAMTKTNVVLGRYVPSKGVCMALTGHPTKAGKIPPFKKFEVLTQNFFGVVKDFTETWFTFPEDD